MTRHRVAGAAVLGEIGEVVGLLEIGGGVGRWRRHRGRGPVAGVAVAEPAAARLPVAERRTGWTRPRVASRRTRGRTRVPFERSTSASAAHLACPRPTDGQTFRLVTCDGVRPVAC